MSNCFPWISSTATIESIFIEISGNFAAWSVCMCVCLSDTLISYWSSVTVLATVINCGCCQVDTVFTSLTCPLTATLRNFFDLWSASLWNLAPLMTVSGFERTRMRQHTQRTFLHRSIGMCMRQAVVDAHYIHPHGHQNLSAGFGNPAWGSSSSSSSYYPII